MPLHIIIAGAPASGKGTQVGPPAQRAKRFQVASTSHIRSPPSASGSGMILASCTSPRGTCFALRWPRGRKSA
eukprot:scaffold7381_cov310-Pinguiococcus_pyrenoidosus.AAC.81